MSHFIARAATIAVIAQALYACAATPATTTRTTLVPACRASEVLYCADHGISRLRDLTGGVVME